MLYPMHIQRRANNMQKHQRQRDCQQYDYLVIVIVGRLAILAAYRNQCHQVATVKRPL